MNPALADVLLALTGIYLGLGVVFAIAFVTRGVARVDRGAVGSSLGFRLLLIPGCTAFWPLLVLRWRRADGVPPEERDAHAPVARGAGA